MLQEPGVGGRLLLAVKSLYSCSEVCVGKVKPRPITVGVGLSAGLTKEANVAIATGPALLGAPVSSVMNLIYYIINKNLFSLRSQYFAKFAISSKRRFSIERCLCPQILVCCFLYRRNKRHKIAVSSVVISPDLLLNLAEFSQC